MAAVGGELASMTADELRVRFDAGGCVSCRQPCSCREMMRFLAMFANINLALGLATFLGWVAGVGLFVITVFSVSHEIILGGVVVAMLIALFLFVVFYYLIARIPAKDRAPAAMAVVVVLHAVLVVANVIAVIFGVPLVYGALFNPRISNAVPVTETSVFAAVVTCAVLSLGLLVEKSLRPTGSLQRQ